jgi:hypothetical protein
MGATHLESLILPINFEARRGTEVGRRCIAYLLRVQD